MDEQRVTELRERYRACLLNDVVPFWLDHALDSKEGGYFSCLARDGSVYSSDKSMLLVCRTVWLFSRLYNTIEKRAEWLAAADLGYRFLVRHLDLTEGRPALVVSRDGQPLERLFFSVEAYAVMACSEYAAAAGDPRALERAWSLHHRLTFLYETPGGEHARGVPAERRSKELVVPILMMGASRELRRTTSNERCSHATDGAAEHILSHFFDPEMQMVRETVSLQGDELPAPRGGLFIPGHSLHAAWVLMEEGTQRDRRDLVECGLRLLSGAFEHGWDKECGGFYSSIVGPGLAQMQPDWDMKLWWVHNEALYATLLAYHITREARYLAWHEQVREYAFGAFPDVKFGEWYGYLHRDGTVALSAKGTMWKGVFHLASSMWQCLQLLKPGSADRGRPDGKTSGED